MPNPEPQDYAWRGFVTREGRVIAWPTLLAEHKDFLRIFYTEDAEFAARWRQWEPGGPIDIDRGGEPSRPIIEAWLEAQRG